MSTERILFVDDEPKILEAYRRTLRKSFSIVAAESANEALEKLSNEGPFPVIVSDMQMPEVNGVELLSKVKELYPDTVRMMLTGNADQQTAVDAINTGDVYRFMNKPCPPDDMIEAINAALRQYELQNAETLLLESTVKGSIEALSEILSIVRPEIFGRTGEVKFYVNACVKALELPNSWEFEAIAMLSQIGCVALPDEMLGRASKGLPLSADDKKIFDKHADLAANLIMKIPRLDGVANAVSYQNKDFDGGGTPADNIAGEDIPLGARLLRPILDLVSGESVGLSKAESIARVHSQAHKYDPRVLEALESIIANEGQAKVFEINISQLQPGHIIAQDIKTHTGALLVEKGLFVSESLAARLNNFFRNGEIAEKLIVSLSEDST